MQMNATYTHTNEIIIMSDDDYNHTTIKLLCNMFIDNGGVHCVVCPPAHTTKNAKNG